MSGHNQNVNLDIGGLFGRSLDIIKADIVNWALIGLVGALALGCGSWGGYHYCAQKQLSGQKPEVLDVLHPFSNPQLLIPIILIVIGSMFCVIPGVILAVLWAFAIPLMVQRGLAWKDAADMSSAAVKDNLGAALLILLLTGFVANAGSMLLGIGLLITLPLSQIMMYLALDQFFGPGATPQQLDYAPGAPAPMAAAPMAAPMAAHPMAAPMAAHPMAAPMAAHPMAAPMAAHPMAAPPMAAHPMAAPPAAAPMAAPPAAAPMAAPVPGTPAPVEAAPPAPAPAPAEPAAEDDGVVETAQQATAGAAVPGKTMAMSAVDFEAMLKNRGNDGDE